ACASTAHLQGHVARTRHTPRGELSSPEPIDRSPDHSWPTTAIKPPLDPVETVNQPLTVTHALRPPADRKSSQDSDRHSCLLSLSHNCGRFMINFGSGRISALTDSASAQIPLPRRLDPHTRDQAGRRTTGREATP